MSNMSDLNGGPNNISVLADQIKRHADVLANFADLKGLSPSLNANGDSLEIDASEKSVLSARDSLLGALKELKSLIRGPVGILMDIGANEILCLQAISRYQISQAMADDNEISFNKLSERCGLNVKDLERILRYAMTNYIFCEPRPGIVAHSATSQMLARNEIMQDFVENVCEIRFPASARVVDALEKYGSSNHPGFSLSRNTARGLYDELTHSPQEAQQWNSAMNALAQQIDLDWVFESFLRTITRHDHLIIVDVGRGHGDISLSLAEFFPNASIVVQNLPGIANIEGRQDSAHLNDRIRHELYDVYDIQPCVNADVYYFRNIFHNWPDADCIKVLRNQIPALKPGALVFIDDFTLHEPGTLNWAQERKRRSMDINMLVLSGLRERSVADWRALLMTAHPSFELIHVSCVEDQPNSILQVQWKGSCVAHTACEAACLGSPPTLS